MPRAVVISFGDELISGQRVDTNSAWLSAQLEAIGLPVVMHLSVGDDLENCSKAIRFAATQAEIIVMTGGLGPTADDLARAALAAATGHELQLDESALAHIQRIFSSRAQEMPPCNRTQAMFPRGSVAIPNPQGTAPGIDLSTDALGTAARFIALPGVPAEAKQMWSETVEARLSRGVRMPQLIRHYTLKCFGDGESAIGQRLGELMRRDRTPLIGITVHQATISLRVTAKGSTVERCRAAADPMMNAIRARLGNLVFGENEEELQDVVVKALARRNESLATVECDNRGLLVGWLATAARRCGAPDVYRGGVASSHATALNALIDIDPSLALDATTEEFCRRAAESIRRQCHVTHALVVGAIPEDGKNRASVHVAVSNSKETHVMTAPYIGHTDVRGPRLIKSALNLLRLYLLDNH
jgi:nicotinamide-nucleotide amidase